MWCTLKQAPEFALEDWERPSEISASLDWFKSRFCTSILVLFCVWDEEPFVKYLPEMLQLCGELQASNS